MRTQYPNASENVIAVSVGMSSAAAERAVRATSPHTRVVQSSLNAAHASAARNSAAHSEIAVRANSGGALMGPQNRNARKVSQIVIAVATSIPTWCDLREMSASGHGPDTGFKPADSRADGGRD